MNERCARVRERLSAYLDGELDASAAAEVEAHLAGCDACATTLADWAAADDTLAGALPDRADAEWEALASRVDAAIEREVTDVARAAATTDGPARWWNRLRPRRVALGSAATLVLALLIAVLQPWWDTDTPAPVDTLGEPGPVLRAAPHEPHEEDDDEADEETAAVEETGPQAHAVGRAKEDGASPPPTGAEAGTPEDAPAAASAADVVAPKPATTMREDDAARGPEPVLRKETADVEADANAAVPAAKSETQAAPPAAAQEAAPEPIPEREQETARVTPQEEAPRSNAVAPQPLPSRSRQEPGEREWGSTKSLSRPPAGVAPILPETRDRAPIRSEWEWERDLQQLTWNALATDDPQPSLALAREWDRFHAAYPGREDVLDDRAAAWTRAARLRAEGACDEAPGRIDEWLHAAGDDAERARAQTMRDELSLSCP